MKETPPVKSEAVPMYPVGGWVLVTREPKVGYCLAGFATRGPLPPGLQWSDSPPPKLGATQVLLVLGPGSCAFVVADWSPTIVVTTSGTDVVVHVHYGPGPTRSSDTLEVLPRQSDHPEGWPLRLSLDEAVGVIVPEPAKGGRLIIMVHGSIMGSGPTEKTETAVLEIDGARPVGSEQN
jgi:hypothetical protein